MKVSLATHGGQLAGMHLHRPPLVVDTASLPLDAAEELSRLVAAAKTSPDAVGAAPGLARDAVSYTITIEDGGEPFVIVQSDLGMSPAFIALRNWIREHSARK